MNEERTRIVRHLREAAARLLAVGMADPKKFELRKIEIAAAVLEDAADMIEIGDHWREFV